MVLPPLLGDNLLTNGEVVVQNDSHNETGLNESHCGNIVDTENSPVNTNTDEDIGVHAKMSIADVEPSRTEGMQVLSEDLNNEPDIIDNKRKEFREQLIEFLTNSTYGPTMVHDDFVSVYQRSAAMTMIRRDSTAFRTELEGMNDEDFYEFCHTTFGITVSDEALKASPDIRQYVYEITLSEHDQAICLREYARRRLEDKRHNTHPGLTERKNAFMLGQSMFVKDFSNFLVMHFKLECYAELASRAFELSRGEPTDEFPKGIPLLSATIRASNQAKVTELHQCRDPAYNPVGGYIQYLNDSALNSGALLYAQWQQSNIKICVS